MNMLVKINHNAIEFTRKLKPVLLIGSDSIPLWDEIELEMILWDATPLEVEHSSS